MTPQTPLPELYSKARVQAPSGMKVTNTESGVGYYSDTEPTEVTVTPHIYQLIKDGDLIVIIDPTAQEV